MATKYESYETTGTYVFNILESVWAAQTFTPQYGHTITSVQIKAYRLSTPGLITVGIYATDAAFKPTGIALCSGSVDGDTFTTSTSGAWYEITLGAGAPLEAGVLYAIVIGGAAGTSQFKCVKYKYDSPGTYADGALLQSNDAGVTWSSPGAGDGLFQEWGDPNAATVTTQAVTAISGTTATGNGKITDIGGGLITQHGHCWNTTGTPTTADSKTTNGAGAVGVFASAITGLTAGTKYYVRAYATNVQGTAYGGEVIFIADKGTVYPQSDPLSRVTSIVRTFWAGVGGQSVYQAQLILGGLSTTYIPPIGARETQGAVSSTALPSGPGYQPSDYQAWLKQSDINLLVRVFGHFPSYLDFLKWKQAQLIQGAK